MFWKKTLISVAVFAVAAANGCGNDDSAADGSGGTHSSGSGGTGPGGASDGGTGGSSNANTGGMQDAGGASGTGAMGGGMNGSCFSPTQGLSSAYSAGSEGCPCSEYEHDRCIEGVALVCQDGLWQAVEDGPCEPSICTQPLDVDSTCKIASYVGFWHNAETGQCEPFMGGCPRNDNGFRTFEECSDACQNKVTPIAVVPWEDCEGLGEQITQSGDESSFIQNGSTLQKQLDWGCGCPTRPVFTMAYLPESPVELRLCKDVGADTCEALCSTTLTFDLSQALQDAGVTEFVFAD